jgi:NACHT domain
MAARSGSGSDASAGPVAEFCAALKELCRSSGVNLRALAREIKISRAQLYAILNGVRKTPPDWDDFVYPLVKACVGDNPGAVDYWQHQYDVMVGVYEQLNRLQRKTPRAADPASVSPPAQLVNMQHGPAAAEQRESTAPPPVLPYEPDSAGRPGEPRNRELDRLAEVVLQQWSDEYKARKFNDAVDELKVSWKPADQALMSDWPSLVGAAVSGTRAQAGARSELWAVGPEELGGSDHDLAAVLDRVPTGWLVVLGEPGYGKSMLMLKLVTDLISQRDPGDPVPLFVPMTTWNPEADTLQAWLGKRLPNDYRILGTTVSGAAARRPLIADLLARQRIVLILDGLDEMPVEHQRRAIDRLKEAFARSDRPLHLVVTCRTTEYRAIANAPGEPWNPIRGAAAVELQPPTGAEVARYLSRDGNDHRWDRVVSELSDQASVSVVREALEVPLFACLASAIYNQRRQLRGKTPEPDELRTGFPNADSIREHLLVEFIPAMYPNERETEESRAREEKRKPGRLPAERRLMFIASQLEARKLTRLEWWNLDGFAPWWLPAVAVGIVSGIAVGVAAARGTHVGVGIGVGFGSGMLIAEVIGLAFRYARKRWDQEGFKKWFERRRPGPGMAGGVVGALLGGLGAGVAGHYHIGHQATLFSGVPEALGIGIGAGSVTDFPGGLIGTAIGSFVAGYLAAVGLGLPAGMVNGLGAGVAAGLAVAYMARREPSVGAPVWERHIGVPAGLIVGLAIGLAAWREVGVIGGLIVGVLIAAAAAVPLGMRYREEELDTVPSPEQAFARDASTFRRTTLWAGVAAGLVGFLGGAVTSIFEVGAKPRLSDFVSDGLGIGLSSGLVVGLCFGFYHAASPRFRILSLWLFCRGKVPLLFRHFLDEAHRKTVLRQVGAAYEFRHRILQNYLAERESR